MFVTPSIVNSSTGELAEPPRIFDPYALLGMERRADLTPDAVRALFLKACRAVHPDRFQDKGGEQLERSKAWTALLNKAHATLRDVRARLAWLIEAEGFANPLKDSKGSAVPQALLMEMFELQEMLDEAEAGNAADSTTIRKAHDDLLARQAKIEDKLLHIAKQWDIKGRDHAALAHKIGERFAEERYYERLLTRMNMIMETEKREVSADDKNVRKS